MENCKNCKHSTTRDICTFCTLTYEEIPHPLLMGGKKCPAYEKCSKKEKKNFEYPKGKSQTDTQ